MFIISKKNFQVRRADGSPFLIHKDFVGQIPDDVADHWLIRAAIADGSVAASTSAADRPLDRALDVASNRAEIADIRPDARGRGRKEKGK